VCPIENKIGDAVKTLIRDSYLGPDVAPTVDYTKEELHFESGPHLGDAAVNVVAAATLIWIPLTVASLTRAAFVKYRFTNMRMSVITSAPWKSASFPISSSLALC
jgi:hypothetical protein